MYSSCLLRSLVQNIRRMQWLCIITVLNIQYTNGAPWQVCEPFPGRAGADDQAVDVLQPPLLYLSWAESCVLPMLKSPGASPQHYRFWVFSLLSLCWATPAEQNWFNVSWLGSPLMWPYSRWKSQHLLYQPMGKASVWEMPTRATICFCSPLSPIGREKNWEPEDIPVSQWVSLVLYYLFILTSDFGWQLYVCFDNYRCEFNPF